MPHQISSHYDAASQRALPKQGGRTCGALDVALGFEDIHAFELDQLVQVEFFESMFLSLSHKLWRNALDHGGNVAVGVVLEVAQSGATHCFYIFRSHPLYFQADDLTFRR